MLLRVQSRDTVLFTILYSSLEVLDPQLRKPILAGNFPPEYQVSLFDAVYKTCFAR